MASYSLEKANHKNHVNIFLSILIFLMSIFLNQSNVILGVNISFSDIFCILLILFVLFENNIKVPIIPLIYFVLVSIVVLITATFYVPIEFGTFPSIRTIVSDYIKLAAIFLYFFIGYNLMKLDHMEKIIKWYSVVGVLIGLVGIFFTFTNIRVFSSIFFYGDIRFRGLMIDPNYYAVIQITALVYISRIKTLKLRYKYLAALITFLAVLTSGSKTGIITLFCYTIFRMLEYVFSSKKKVSIIGSKLLLIGIVAVITPFLYGLLQNYIIGVTSNIPTFARVQSLITDFGGAISGDGSERDMAWGAALQIISHSPLIGIGIGTYMSVASEVFQASDIAHNTYLQISAEWGLPLALILFAYIIYTLLKVSLSRNKNKDTIPVYRDIIIILLIGSLAISLNNARILWLLLGALAASSESKKIIEQDKKCLETLMVPSFFLGFFRKKNKFDPIRISGEVKMEESVGFKEFLQILKRKMMLIIFITLLSTIATGLITYYFITPIYQTSTLLLVNKSSSEENSYSSEEVRTNLELIKTYNVIITSSRILDEVVNQLSLNQTGRSLSKQVTVESERDSQVISIRVKAKDPEIAAKIANTIATVFQSKVTEIMNVNNVSILTQAEIETTPISPNLVLNTVIAFFVGLLLSIGLSLMVEFFDNKIRKEEDIEKFVGLPILGTVMVIDVKKRNSDTTKSDLVSRAYSRKEGENIGS